MKPFRSKPGRGNGAPEEGAAARKTETPSRRTPGEGAAQSLRLAFSRDSLKGQFTSRAFRAGGYSAAVCVVVIAIAAVAVAIAQALPSSYASIDISEGGTSTLSDDSIAYLASLTEDVTIYLVAEEGSEDEYLAALLPRYAEASAHVTVEQRDPVLYPAFANQYTSDGLVIECGDDYRIVESSSLYELGSSYTYEFVGESAITNAIVALTSADLPVVYTLTGHGESSLPTTIESDLEDSNYVISDLNLLAVDAVPDDADAVIMYVPTSDLSDDERDRLLAYLEAGGRFLLVTDYGTDAPNIDAVMAAYGLEAVDGVVVEGSSGSSLSGYPYYLLPTLGTSDAVGDVSESASVVVPMAHGIAETDEAASDSDLTVEAILSTSDSAYVKTDPENAQTLSQEEGDIAGQTMVGASATRTLDDGSEARVVWYSSSMMLDDTINMQIGGTNGQLFAASLAWLADAQDTTLSISGKSLGTTTLVIDAASAITLSAFVVAVVPAAFLICGFTVWRDRRRR